MILSNTAAELQAKAIRKLRIRITPVRRNPAPGSQQYRFHPADSKTHKSKFIAKAWGPRTIEMTNRLALTD
jgi:hypothetical protein